MVHLKQASNSPVRAPVADGRNRPPGTGERTDPAAPLGRAGVCGIARTSLLGVIARDRRMRRRSIMTGVVAAGLLAGYPWHALAAELSGNVVLAADGETVIWAAIHRRPEPAGNDPWYHIEVIAKDRRSEPWIFRRMATHMAITPDALLASRSDRRAKTYGYKPEQFITAYRQWRDQPQEIRDRHVCRRTVLACLTLVPAE